MRNLLGIGIALTVGLAASAAHAQQRGFIASGHGGDVSNEGCALPQPPTVSSCWSCFQSLLADCDDNNPEGTRRQACYTAANNFFTWCLGRVGNNRSGRIDLNQSISNEKTYDIRGDTQYEMFVPEGTEAEDVVVFLRYFNGIESVQTRLNPNEYFVFDQTGVDDMFFIVIDSTLHIDESKSVGIVTGIEDDNGEISYGFAFSADVTDSFDLNNDGFYDNADRVEAMQMFSKGEMDHPTLVRILHGN